MLAAGVLLVRTLESITADALKNFRRFYLREDVPRLKTNKSFFAFKRGFGLVSVVKKTYETANEVIESLTEDEKTQLGELLDENLESEKTANELYLYFGHQCYISAADKSEWTCKLNSL